MKFFLFIIVLVIPNTQGRARPMESSVQILHLPQKMQLENEITINGTLEPEDKSFTWELLNGNDNSENCTVVYDFENNRVKVTPAADAEFESAEFDIVKPIKGHTYEFRLNLTSESTNGGHQLIIHFMVNDIDTPSTLICNVNNLQDMTEMVMREGVKSLKLVSFKYGEDVQ